MTTVVKPDPSITSAEVMFGKRVEVGARVKHWGQRYTPFATATVIGFYHAEGFSPQPWVKVLVEHDHTDTAYNFPAGWDWDRTEVAENDPWWRGGAE